MATATLLVGCIACDQFDRQTIDASSLGKHTYTHTLACTHTHTAVGHHIDYCLYSSHTLAILQVTSLFGWSLSHFIFCIFGQFFVVSLHCYEGVLSVGQLVDQSASPTFRCLPASLYEALSVGPSVSQSIPPWAKSVQKRCIGGDTACLALLHSTPLLCIPLCSIPLHFSPLHATPLQL